MAFLLLAIWGSLWGLGFKRLRLLRRRGIPAHRLYLRLAWGLGGLIYVCMAGQIYLAWRMGALTWQLALPLHLCSFVGVITLPVLLSRSQTGWEFCLYLGLPGALGALAFPSILPCPWQALMDLCFLSLHCLLIIAPLLPWAAGARPRPRGIWPVFAWANAFLALVLLVNHGLGANFLFLQAAPAGTPLALLHSRGTGGYVLALEGLALLLLRAEAAGIGWFLAAKEKRRLCS